MDVRFDDLPALQALLSEDFGPFGEGVTVTQAMIDRFADLVDDHQWIHVDVERCRQESPFGGPIAHGFLVLSLLTALKPPTGPRIVGYGSLINYGADKLRFVQPVLAGSDIHARRRVAHVRKKGVGGSQLTFETEIWVVGSDKAALLYRSLVLYLP